MRKLLRTCLPLLCGLSLLLAGRPAKERAADRRLRDHSQLIRADVPRSGR